MKGKVKIVACDYEFVAIYLMLMARAVCLMLATNAYDYSLMTMAIIAIFWFITLHFLVQYITFER